MSIVDGRLCGSQEPELLRFLLSAGISSGRVGDVLARLDREGVDNVDDLTLLDLERCLMQVAAGRIRKALDSQERDLCPATPTRAGPAAREDEVTPPAAPSKQAAGRDPVRRGVVRRVQFYPDEGVVRLQAATRLQAAERRRSAKLCVKGLRDAAHAEAEQVQGAAARIQAAWRGWVARLCYLKLRSWPLDCYRWVAWAMESCCLPPGMLRVLARDHAARVVQDAYLHSVEQGSWGRARRRRAWEGDHSQVERETILSYFPNDGIIDLFWFGEGLDEAIVRIQAVWRGARVRAAAVREYVVQPGPCPGVRALLRGFDAHAASALFAARWAAATAQDSTAVIYNAAPAEGDNKQAVPQARGDEKQSDADTAPQLRVARSEAGGDSDADAACLPKPTQSSPLPQPTSGQGRGQPAAGQTPTSSADPSATRRPFLLSMSAGLVRMHISGMRDSARVFRWEHYELLEAYDAWLRGVTVKASWDGEDCLTGGMYSGNGPQCDAGWINWIFQKLFAFEVCGCTIDVRRPCSSQRHAFANCGWREGWAPAGAVLQAMMEHEQVSMMDMGGRRTLQQVQAARAALDARRARAARTANAREEQADMLWELDDEEDDGRHDSGGDDDDQDYTSHDDDDVQ